MGAVVTAPTCSSANFDGSSPLNYTIIALGGSTALFFFVAYFVAAWKEPDWSRAALRHPQASAGIPFAAMLAFILVTIFKTTSGSVEISGFGFSFSGAGGNLVMWIFCFLSIIAALRALWPPAKTADDVLQPGTTSLKN